MYMYTQGHSRFISLGAFVPDQRVTSSEIMELIDSKNRFDVPYSWLERMTGIEERRAASEGTQPSDMAAAAATEALDRAGIAPTAIDAIIYAGVDRDYVEPACAHLVQNKIGASNAVVFDLTNACHGFMNALHVMDALIATGQVRRGLIVTAERGYVLVKRAIETLQNTHDKELFNKLAGGLTLGDCGAAMIVGPKLGPDSGFMGFMLQSQGQHAGLCVLTHGGGKAELFTDMPNIVKEHLQMHADMYGHFMEKLEWKPGEVSKFVHHQVGKKAFKLHSEYSRISQAIMSDTVTTMGNIASATIPMNLYNLLKNKDIQLGEKVFIAGAGSGLSISQAGLVWDAA